MTPKMPAATATLPSMDVKLSVFAESMSARRKTTGEMAAAKTGAPAVPPT